MRRLMLLRHAKSDWPNAPMRDLDRRLAPRGREAAPKIGIYMARHGLEPDLVACSTALRARETLDLVASALQHKIRVVHDKRLYGASADLLLAVIRETPRDVHALLVVGHNPEMQSLAELLIASGEVETRQRLIEKFPTCSLAVIDFPLDDWRKLHPRSGRLDRLVAPRSLENETD